MDPLSAGISAALSIGESLITRLFPDPKAQAEQRLALTKLAQDGDLAKLNAHVQLMVGQLEINKAEAQHKSLFVAGWRPFIGWAGGFSLAYAGILEPLLRFISSLAGYTGDYPEIDTTITTQVVMGMLGIGAMRSFDKSKGTQTDSIKAKQ